MEALTFAIIDLKTTGNFASGHAILELAIIKIEHGEVVDTLHSFVNPQRNVPAVITSITGIVQEDVNEAPTFEALAEDVERITRDCILVAHQVNFDYIFLKRQMEACGIPFQRRRLCTMRLARWAFPGLRSYSLKSVCGHLGLPGGGVHRAMDDAQACADILNGIIGRFSANEVGKLLSRFIQKPSLPSGLDENALQVIPNAPGVYYLLDGQGEILYIGKAKKLKQRVSSHFTGISQDRRKQLFQRLVAQVDFQLTGNEALAALMEDAEIKRHRPRLNVAQKYVPRVMGIYRYEDREGRPRLGIQAVRPSMPPLKRFASYYAARNWLLQSMREKEIPLEVAGVYPMGHADWMLSSEEKDNLGEQLSSWLNNEVADGHQVFVGAGRDEEEHSFVYFYEGLYRGFGFFPIGISFKNPAEITEYLWHYSPSVEAHSIASRYLSTYFEELHF